MSSLKNNLVFLAWAHNLEHIFKYYEIYYQSQTKLLIAKRSFKFTLTSLQLSRTVQLWNLEGFLGKKL